MWYLKKKKILPDLAKTSNNVFKSFESKGKKTVKHLTYFTFAYNKVNNLGYMQLLPKINKRQFHVLVGD